MVFSSSHVWMWELDYKESWAPKNWCFWTVVLEKTLESPLDCKIRPGNLKGNQSWIFTGSVPRRGTPCQGPKLGSCLTLGNELSEETHVLTKREILLGKGTRVGWGNPGEQLCLVACSLRFYGDGISFRVVFSQSFWLRVLPGAALFSQDGCQRGFWEMVRHVASPFDLSWTLPVDGLLVPFSLPRPPVVKQLMQMVTMVPGQGGRFQSVCFP